MTKSESFLKKYWGDYIIHKRYFSNIILFKLILLWCVVYTQQLSFTNETLLKTVSHFVPRSLVPVSGVPSAPVPVADCHWSQPPLMAVTLRPEANLAVSIIARVVFCYLASLATHEKNIHKMNLLIGQNWIKIMSSCWFDCVCDEMLLCSHSPVGGAGAGHNGAMSIPRIIYNWFFIVIAP